MVVECGLQESWHEFVVDSLRWLGEGGYFFVQKQLGELAKKKKKSVGKEGLLEDESEVARNVEAGGCWSEPRSARARAKVKGRNLM